MAQPRPKAESASVWKSLAVVVPTVLVVLGGAYWALDHRIDRLDDRLNEITKTGGPLEKLDERLRKVEAGIAAIQVELTYRPRAAALGLQNPDLKRVRLTPQAVFTTRTVTATGISADLTYTILRIAAGQIEIRIDGRVGNIILENTVVNMPLRQGELTPIRFITGPGIPTLYIVVLDRPAPDEAVVAVGTVTSPAGKPS